MRREIRHVVELDDRAWHALVELSGAERATALVDKVAEARTQRTGAVDPAAGHGWAASTGRESRRFADMTLTEREARRNEFKAQLREAAGQAPARSEPIRERTPSRGRGGPEIGD